MHQVSLGIEAGLDPVWGRHRAMMGLGPGPCRDEWNKPQDVGIQSKPHKSPKRAPRKVKVEKGKKKGNIKGAAGPDSVLRPTGK